MKTFNQTLLIFGVLGSFDLRNRQFHLDSCEL